ncbi:hypothetical protein SDC9_160580 [bioreactor metagenome]|uniref:Uncharacterized protein n=1 Tax=bioreactor metagenome TaxID=1076179 RepID=A0A645FIT9_9ZZZZ
MDQQCVLSLESYPQRLLQVVFQHHVTTLGHPCNDLSPRKAHENERDHKDNFHDREPVKFRQSWKKRKSK